MLIVVYERRILIDHILRIKFGEGDESSGGIVLIYCPCTVDQIVEAVKLTEIVICISVLCTRAQYDLGYVAVVIVCVRACDALAVYRTCMSSYLR